MSKPIFNMSQVLQQFIYNIYLRSPPTVLALNIWHLWNSWVQMMFHPDSPGCVRNPKSHTLGPPKKMWAPKKWGSVVHWCKTKANMLLLLVELYTYPQQKHTIDSMWLCFVGIFGRRADDLATGNSATWLNEILMGILLIASWCINDDWYFYCYMEGRHHTMLENVWY